MRDGSPSSPAVFVATPSAAAAGLVVAAAAAAAADVAAAVATATGPAGGPPTTPSAAAAAAAAAPGLAGVGATAVAAAAAAAAIQELSHVAVYLFGLVLLCPVAAVLEHTYLQAGDVLLCVPQQLQAGRQTDTARRAGR